MARKSIRVVAAVIQREGRYLITQRRNEAVLGGLWEFPGGRVEEGESDEQALQRELGERIDVHADIHDQLAERHTAYEDYDVTLVLYAASFPASATLRTRRVRDFRWIESHEFERYPFPAADQQTMDALLGFKR